MPPRSRRDELATDAALLGAQVAVIAERLAPLAASPDADQRFGAPSVLPGWDLRVLLAHLVLVVGGMIRWLDRPSGASALSALEYAARYRASADDITALTVQTAARDDPAALLHRLTEAAAQARDALRGRDAATVIDAARGPIRTGDWVATRLLDVVVHTDDLARSLQTDGPSQHAAVPFAPGALRRCARLLVSMIAEKAPGHTVELRVPPAAAAQIVAGPRHTRGTPPNVVETDPLTWVRLATGRVEFADARARGDLRASGARSDLTDLLPLF